MPVYRNLPVSRRCIDAVLANTSLSHARLIVVDDASPEPELASWCDSLAHHGATIVLRNEQNKGFVASVNLAMRHSSDRDVVLLNSDTEVPPGWLERLQRCALSQDKVATVTPFSNNGTICSYPFFCRSSELPEGLSCVELDRIFAQANTGLSEEIPTAVGFCMYISRACLDDIGYFDDQRYGRGYGEENDFSRRAASYGWRNFLCADLFVYHQGGVSFGDDRVTLMSQADRLLADRYPDYPEIITEFIDRDPLRQYREAVDRLRFDMENQPLVLLREYQQQLLIQHQTMSELRQRLLANRDEHLRVEGQLREQLDNNREAYFAADRALGEAQDIVKRYDADLRRLASNYEAAASELYSIKNSRFWRYSRWIRKLLDR